ncbi:anaerobic ribonucleoside-triphosphate reductase activating protein [Ruminococcus sp.]|uniref:anaerobic ribonucleoside-triphosphate reductase activating protein n=1 Tax=Ruminococcus sp. TaxID=41978 RepID=UPI0025F2F105|nr:anaerobic ribonucleoside-triphosphate reductase activating protein [Ruminococcus sp.]MCI6617068.1 anaerobic ribonucleoside-triphosphate reductase activating protein [Ruminococcus sp.]
MNYGEIKNYDIANGEGVRVSLFVSGCTHHCKNCFNPETWSFEYGKPFTKETEDYIIECLSPDYIDGLSLLGGEPFEPQNQEVLLPFLRKVKNELPNKNIWCYTGYLFDRELLSESRARCEFTDEMLSLIDVLVDGEFVQALHDISLAFRGSSNQRIIDVQKSLETGEVKLHNLMSRNI